MAIIMKNKIRIAYLAFILVFVLSLFSVPVFADEEDEEQVVTDAPIVTQAPATAAPKTRATQAPTKKVTQATKRATQAPTRRQTYATRANNNISNNNNNNTYRYTQSTQATRKAVVSSTKAATSPVYDTDKEKVATGTLKKNDWASIAEQLKKSDSDSTKTDVENFDYIKNNTSDGDNGIWILYTGIGLEIAAALIILTLIILAVRRRKKNKAQHASASHAAAHASRERDDYRDSYKEARREAPRRSAPTKSQQRGVNRRSKFDTDEVNVNRQPRRSGRYKPRH